MAEYYTISRGRWARAILHAVADDNRSMERYQHTIKKPVIFTGTGLHSGQSVRMTISPARTHHGIRFKRYGSDDSIPAFVDRVVDTSLATTIAERGMVVSTTEHLLAALVGLGIDNVLIELDGAEVPIMDGSAAPFVEGLRGAGRTRQRACRRIIKITRTISYREGDKVITVTPYDGFKLTCHIGFNHSVIKSQSYSIDVSAETFCNEISAARTFGFIEQVEALQATGFALGGSLDNAVVIGQQGVMNEGGLRFGDEFARHKILDLLGDLALLGCRLQGHVEATKSGHGQHLALMQEIIAHAECWQDVDSDLHPEAGMLDSLVTSMNSGSAMFPFLHAKSCPASL